MLGSIYILLTIFLGWRIRARIQLTKDIPGFLGFAASAAVSHFIAAWIGFAWYLLLGLNYISFTCALLTMIALILWNLKKSDRDEHLSTRKEGIIRIAGFLTENKMLFLYLFLILPLYLFGLKIHQNGVVQFNFNFIDTAQHLSYAQSFLTASRFPPLDLNMAGYPLKYHFVCDFYCAFLFIGGMRIEYAMYLLNIYSAFLLVITMWIVFKHLLGKGAWIGIFIFFFTNQALSNLIHYFLFDPPYYSKTLLASNGVTLLRKLHHLIFFPYFNFEDVFTNMFEPQRAFLFALPVAMLILLRMIRLAEKYDRRDILETTFFLVLMPFSHIIIFMVFSLYQLFLLFRHREHYPRWLLPVAILWVIAFLQLFYLKFYGPPLTQQYSGWDAQSTLPLHDFSILPNFLRIIVFWLFVNGEFFILGFLGVALILYEKRFHNGVSILLRKIFPFVTISFCIFLLINFYRYTINWGDSNKFVLFLNFWLALISGYGISLFKDRRRLLGNGLTILIIAVLMVPWLWNNVERISRSKQTLFDRHDVVSAAWINSFIEKESLFLVSPQHIDHFIPPLTGRAVVAGIYSNVNPYTYHSTFRDIRKMYERADAKLIATYGVDYIFVGRRERSAFRVNPIFSQNRGLVFETAKGAKGARIYRTDQLFREKLPRFLKNSEHCIEISGIPAVIALDGWGGHCRMNRNGRNNELKVGDLVVKRGIFAHAPSRMAFKLYRKFTRFRAKLGIENDGCNLASVKFIVASHGKIIGESDVIRYNEPPREFECDITGINEIELIAGVAGDGNTCDHAVWIEPVFEDRMTTALGSVKYPAAFLALIIIQTGLLLWGIAMWRKRQGEPSIEREDLSSVESSTKDERLFRT